MEKQLKDYLHFHLGCRCEIETFGNKHYGILTGCSSDYYCVQVDGDRSETYHSALSSIKLILRPLSGMNEREFIKVCKIMEWNTDEYDVYWFTTECLDRFFTIPLINSFELTKYLLSKGFDLFNLHESGLCIYKEEIK